MHNLFFLPGFIHLLRHVRTIAYTIRYTGMEFSSLYEFATSISYVSQASEHRKNVTSFLSPNLSFSAESFYASPREKILRLKSSWRLILHYQQQVDSRLQIYIADDSAETAQYWDFIKICLIKFIWPTMRKQTFNIARSVNATNLKKKIKIEDSKEIYRNINK